MAEINLFDRKFFQDILNREYKEGVFECEKHGSVKCDYYIDEHGRNVWNECPLCVAEREKEQEEKERLAELEKQKTAWRESNVKEKFFDMTFDDYEELNDTLKVAKEKLMAIANGGNRSLLLLGSNGLGKTMLASLAVMQRGGYIFKMYEIIVQIKSSYKSNSTVDEADILKMLSSCPLLVIDEVGKQFGSESERNWLSYVIDERYECGKPTVLMSNLKLQRDCTDEEKREGLYIEHYLGRDSVSRLVECADIVNIKGDDYRRRKPLTDK
jgi:DNA replication protein DnaC